jgi:cell division protein FtsL
MTPPTAVTPAARTQRASGSGPARPASPHPSTPRSTHRAPLRRSASASAAPAAPRRVSGPARPATRPTARPTARPSARPATRPAARPSGESVRVRRAPRTAAPRTAAAPRRPLGVRAAAYLRTLPDHSVLDRVVRGRLWIPLLGVLLVGIVAMQVEVLKLNASVGHAMVRASTLQSRNQQLRVDVSQLSDDQRIMADAANMGMAMPAPSTPKFVAENGRTDLARALSNIHAPDPTGFAARASAAAATAAAAATTSSGE